MKKLLIASTALVATSGFAYADITFGGSAQFGVIYQEDRADPNAGTGSIAEDATDELFLDYELQFDFSATGETDGGLGFGMSAELESDSDGEGNQSPQGIDPEIFITSGFGTVTIGALDVAPDQAGFGNTRDPGYDGIGIDNNIDTVLFLGLDDFDDAFGSVVSGAAANMMYQGTFGGLSVTATAHAYEEDYAIVGEYDFGAFRIGAMYNYATDLSDLGADDDEPISMEEISGETWAVSAGGTFAGFDLDFVYADHTNDADIDIEAYGLSGAYDLGAYSITFAVNQIEIDPDGADSTSGTDYGIGVEYDLGGGAKLQGGVGNQYLALSDEDRTVASFGLALSF